MPIPAGYSLAPSGFFYYTDGSGPYAVDQLGNAILLGGGGGGGSLSDRAIESIIPPGTTDHTPYFQEALDLGGAWSAGPGPFTITGQLNWTTGTTFIFDNTVINHATTTQRTISAVNVNDWAILGKLTIVGSGNNVGTAVGIYREGCNRFNVDKVNCKNISGHGFYEAPGTFVAPRGDVGSWSLCQANNCYIGREDTPGTGSEYANWYGFDASSCGTANITCAGNVIFHGGNIVDNTAGVWVKGGTNHAHGGFNGCNINHNGSVVDGWNIRISNVDNGETFTGCHVYGDTTTSGYIWIENSKGILFTGGIISAPTKMDNLTGYCRIAQNLMVAAVVVRTAGNSQKKVIYSDNFTDAGMWSGNDPGSIYSRVNRVPNQALTSGVYTDLTYDSESYDVRDCVDPATGTFTFPWLANVRISGTVRVTAASGITANGLIKFLQSGGFEYYAPLVRISDTEAVGTFNWVAGAVAATTVKVQINIVGVTLVANNTQVVFEELT